MFNTVQCIGGTAMKSSVDPIVLAWLPSINRRHNLVETCDRWNYLAKRPISIFNHRRHQVSMWNVLTHLCIAPPTCQEWKYSWSTLLSVSWLFPRRVRITLPALGPLHSRSVSAISRNPIFNGEKSCVLTTQQEVRRLRNYIEDNRNSYWSPFSGFLVLLSK